MAIKFSQFSESTSTSQVDFIVGYDGNQNVKITPSNFLAALGDYLPLTGGTLTGNLTIQKSNPVFELNSNSIFPYGRIEFAGIGQHPFEIVGQSNPGGTSLALRAESSGTMADAFVVKQLSGSVYNYAPKPIRIGADATANELDDYEEGTYNPEFYLGTGSTAYGSGDFTTWTNNSKYVKVGRQVTLFISLTYNGTPSAITSSTNRLNLGNIPFSLAYGEVIGGTYQFGYLKSTVPSTYGYNSVLKPAFNSTTIWDGKIGFTKLEYNAGISLWVNYGLKGNEFPASGPFGSPNTLGGIVTYYTND